MARIGNDIINKCKSGDKEAFRQIIQTYQQMIYSLAFKMLCDEDEAKDIVQETFIRVCRISKDTTHAKTWPHGFTP